MELKTNQVKGNIRIEIYADLDSWDSTETSIKNEILNTPFEYWELDNFNLLDVGNNEVLDIFVFETSNEIIFNVNDML